MAISHLADDGIYQRAEILGLELVVDWYIRSFDHCAVDGLAAGSNALGGCVLVESILSNGIALPFSP
jgi:hypothetical protein